MSTSRTSSCFQKLRWHLTVNDVSTNGSIPYPELEPISTSTDREEIINCIEAVFDDLGSRWRITDLNSSAGTVRGEVDSRWLKFTDDIELSIEEEAKGDNLTINIRSRSRVGVGDLGQNARTIRTLTQRLRNQLPVS